MTAIEHLRRVPFSFAVLDAAGFIIDVSSSWRDFGRAEGLTLPSEGVGHNYLDYCTAPDSTEVAQRIRDLLESHVERIAFLYPCHSPTRRRWFVLIGQPSPRGTAMGQATLFHFDVTWLLNEQVEPMIHPELLDLDRTLPLSDEDKIVALLASSLSTGTSYPDLI